MLKANIKFCTSTKQVFAKPSKHPYITGYISSRFCSLTLNPTTLSPAIVWNMMSEWWPHIALIAEGLS